MTEIEKKYLKYDGWPEEKINEMEKENDYFLLEGPEPYNWIEGFENGQKDLKEKIVESINQKGLIDDSFLDEIIIFGLANKKIDTDTAEEKIHNEIKKQLFNLLNELVR